MSTTSKSLSEVPHSHSDKHRADFYRDTVEDYYDIINTILKGSAPPKFKGHVQNSFIGELVI